MSREIAFSQAILEATDLCMANDPSVYVLGLGVTDPKGIFGTTKGLESKYGSTRVLDMPTSENGMTGVAIGSALVGMRPILTHQRLDFALLSMDQLVNNAAKWHYMFSGQGRVPIVVRMIVGRGWGQGPQHSQSLQAWFAHIPGLKVVMPSTAFDAKGLLISSIEDNNPVIFIEHRWLYNISGHVPEEAYRVPLGKARVMRSGTDLTIVATSYMSLEALRAADMLSQEGIHAEVVDIRTLRPLDRASIRESVGKTGRLIVADTGWKTAGFSAEVLACVAEEAFDDLKSAPHRVALPDYPAPTSPALSKDYYPGAVNIVRVAEAMLGVRLDPETFPAPRLPQDIPDPSFTGPF